MFNSELKIVSIHRVVLFGLLKLTQFDTVTAENSSKLIVVFIFRSHVNGCSFLTSIIFLINC